MKIIHSFWSKPAFHGVQNYENSRKFGGWLSYKYFLLSTCFSCLTLRKYHKKITLYTDTRGSDIFINQLNLPYDDVCLLLDELEHQDHRLWVLGKLKVINLQSEPFLHVDNDVFIWNALSEDFLRSSLIAQSRHLLPAPYKRNLSEVFANFSHIPRCLNNVPAADSLIANIGIIGGTDIDFFQEYCSTAYRFLENNSENLAKINIGGFNQILDEYLFTCLAQEKTQKINFLIDNVNYNNPNVETYEHVLRFHLVPIIDKYIHVVGLAKQSNYACEQLELRLKYEFPGEYKKIVKVIDTLHPDLTMNEETVVIEHRQKQLYKSIHKLYTCSIDELEETKIQLVNKLQIIEPKDKNSIDVKYMAQVVEPITGKESYKELSGANNILLYFDSPISVKELIEAINESEEPIDKTELKQLKSDIMSVVLEKIIISGQLKYVE